MPDNKNYYYLKLKDNFYDRPEIKAIESMQSGYEYICIMQKMYLRSLCRNGKLMLTDNIPYDIPVLSKVLGHKEETVKTAIDIFVKLELCEILNDNSIYMLEIQKFIGKSSTEAERIKEYRDNLKTVKQIECTNVQPMYDNNTPEIELEIELELEKDIKEKINNDTKVSGFIKKEFIELSELLYTEHKKYDDKFLAGKNLKTVFNRWANDIRLLIEKDERDIEDVKKVIIWSQEWAGNGNFSWRNNILSGKKLREKFDTLYGQYMQIDRKNKKLSYKTEYNDEWKKQAGDLNKYKVKFEK